VVQREIPLHLWGRAAPGETVTASFRGESRSVAADELGRFSLHLPPSAAGGPFTLTVSASNTIRLDDVWVGDVWVAAGQSNMELTLDEAEGAAAEIPQARHPQVRFPRAERRTSSFPLADVATDGWRVCTPETAPKVSAVAYFFARHVREHHPVPIGVIDASWGGTPLAAFTPLATIAGDPALLPALVHWSHMADARTTMLLEIEKQKRALEAAAARAREQGQEPPRQPWRPDFDAWRPAAIYSAMVAPRAGQDVPAADPGDARMRPSVPDLRPTRSHLAPARPSLETTEGPAERPGLPPKDVAGSTALRRVDRRQRRE